MCEPSVALECGSDQPRARLTAGPDVREHPCQPRWASFLKVSCEKTAVKTRAFRSEIIIMSVTVRATKLVLIIRIKIRACFARDLAVPLQFTFRRPCTRYRDRGRLGRRLGKQALPLTLQLIHTVTLMGLDVVAYNNTVIYNGIRLPKIWVLFEHAQTVDTGLFFPAQL